MMLSCNFASLSAQPELVLQVSESDVAGFGIATALRQFETQQALSALCLGELWQPWAQTATRGSKPTLGQDPCWQQKEKGP